MRKGKEVHLFKSMNGTLPTEVVRPIGFTSEFEDGESLQKAMEGKRAVPSSSFFFAELAERLMKTRGRHEVQKLVDVMFDFFDTKQLLWHVKRVKDREAYLLKEAWTH